jgi:hypothetical protein
MELLVLSVFVLVYAGMILCEIPGRALDRSAIALLGAIAILASASTADHRQSWNWG